jgi:hypothetical protein
VGEHGAGFKRGAGARSWPEKAWTWARPRRGDRGREVRDALTSGVGGAERERERARARATAPTGRSHGAARERGREGSGLRRQTGSACHAQGRAGAGAHGGWA